MKTCRMKRFRLKMCFSHAVVLGTLSFVLSLSWRPGTAMAETDVSPGCSACVCGDEMPAPPYCHRLLMDEAEDVPISVCLFQSQPPDEEERGDGVRGRHRDHRFGGRGEGEPGQRRGGRMGRSRGPNSREQYMTEPEMLDPEMIELVMGVLKEKMPEWHERLERFKDRKPKRFEKEIQRIFPLVQHYVELRDEGETALADTIIEEFKINEALRGQCRKYHKAEGDPKQQAECEKRVRKLVHRQFEIRFMRHEARLKEFAERIEKQRKQLAQERKRFEEERTRIDELVTTRVDEIKEGKLHEGGRGRGRGPCPRDEMRDRQGRRPRGPDGLGPPPDREDHDGPPPHRRKGRAQEEEQSLSRKEPAATRD